MFSPQTPEGLRQFTSRLKRAESGEEWDRIWCRPVSDYGYIPAVDEPEFGMFDRVTADSLEQLPVTHIDPNEVRYSGQEVLRLDTLVHYLDHVELWDMEPWFGVHYPIVIPFQGFYMARDGNHRIAADRIMKRKSLVIIARPQRLAERKPI